MVLVASMPLVSGPPPTSAAARPPLPFSPWHTAHLLAKMLAPTVGVPLPGGRPVPSGRMLMSQAAISASEMGVPNPCANTVRLNPDTTQAHARANAAISKAHRRTVAPSHHRTHHRTVAPSHLRTHHRTIAPSHHRTHHRTVLDIDMLHLAGPVDGPARRPVVVLARERGGVGHRRFRLAALRDDLCACGLHVAGFVPRAALQNRRPAV